MLHVIGKALAVIEQSVILRGIGIGRPKLKPQSRIPLPLLLKRILLLIMPIPHQRRGDISARRDCISSVFAGAIRDKNSLSLFFQTAYSLKHRACSPFYWRPVGYSLDAFALCFKYVLKRVIDDSIKTATMSANGDVV